MNEKVSEVHEAPTKWNQGE